MPTPRVVGVAVFFATLLAPAAHGGPPGTWSRITDVRSENTDEVGLARTGDGVLHAVWPKRSFGRGQIWHTAISPTGSVGAAIPATGSWDAVDNPDLVVLPSGGLRLFFGGLGVTFAQGGVQSSSAPASGAAWTPHGTRVSQNVGAAGPVGATVLPDGTPIFTWASGEELYVHTGLSNATPDQRLGPSPYCCYYLPNVKRDSASGQVVLAYHSLVVGEHGIFVRTIRPTLGPKRLVPSSLSKGDFVAPDVRTPLVARSRGGLYVAFCGGYPACRTVRLWKVGAKKALTVATDPGVEDVNASAGPAGRIWVLWQNRPRKRIYATRSNRAATRFGPPTTVKPPPGTSSIWKVDGEGSIGTLDLFASVSTPASLATWHTQVLPRLTVKCKGGEIVSCRVADAGDPVARATVKIGGGTLTTNAKGRVSADLRPGRFRVVAAKGGYKGAKTRVRSR